MANLCFKDISVRNFMSVGNKAEKYNFESGITLVVGENKDQQGKNAAGKSSLLVDPLMFCLFGKSVRGIKKNNLINSTNNKECEVIINFKKGKDNYRVTRGIKPSKFIIEKNDIQFESESSSRIDQDKLNVILGGNYNTFLSTIVTCLGYSKPFFELNKFEKRKVLEDILGITIFGKMYETVSAQYNDYKKIRDSLETELSYLQRIIADKINQISNIERRKKEYEHNKEDKFKNLSIDFKELKAIYENKASKINNIDKITDMKIKCDMAIQETSDKLNTKRIELGIIEKDIIRQEKSIKKLKSGKCPTCLTSCETSSIKKYMSDVNADIIKKKNDVVEYSDEILNIDEKLHVYKEKRNKLVEKINEEEILKHELESCKYKIEQIKYKLAELKDDAMFIGDMIDMDVFNADKLKFKDKKKQFENNNENILYADASKKILNERGIKAYIIRKILPFFNKQINYYLKELNVNFNISFDEELQETLKFSKRDDFGYENFSGGEKRRVDIALMLTLLDISQAQNVIDCNIHILDELLDVGLDDSGISSVLQILKRRTETNKSKAIYIITHRTSVDNDLIDREMLIQKHRGFSRIVK